MCHHVNYIICIYVLELLFRTRIFKECKWTNTELHNKAVQEIAKLKVFKHY